MSSYPFCSSRCSIVFTDRLGKKGILLFHYSLILKGPCHICYSPCCWTLFPQTTRTEGCQSESDREPLGRHSASFTASREPTVVSVSKTTSQYIIIIIIIHKYLRAPRLTHWLSSFVALYVKLQKVAVPDFHLLSDIPPGSNKHLSARHLRTNEETPQQEHAT